MAPDGKRSIELVSTHCSKAKRALPDATWKVTIGERAFQWDPIEGFKQP